MRPECASCMYRHKLIEREVRTLELIALGNSQKEIARFESVADQTIKNRMASIFSKLGARNSSNAVLLGLLDAQISIESLRERSKFGLGVARAL